MTETGDRKGQALAYGNLGISCISLGEHLKAKDYLEKALHIMREIGDKKGEASICENLGRNCVSISWRKCQS